MPLAGLERLVTGGVAIANRHDFAGTLDRELDQVMAPRNLVSFLIGDRQGQVREVEAVGADLRTIHREQQPCRFARRLDLVTSPFLAIAIRDDFQRAWLVDVSSQRRRYAYGPFFFRPSD